MTQRPLSTIKALSAGLILLLFIALVEYLFGWRALLAPWREIPPLTIAITIALAFFSYLIRAVRLYDYFRGEMQGRFMLGFRLMLQHNLFNNMLPMRSGEISFPLLMKRYFNVPLVNSLPALFWFRLLDLHSLGLFGLVAVGHYWLSMPQTLLATVFWLTLPGLIFFGQRRLHDLLDPQHPNRLLSLLQKLLASLPQERHHFWRSWLWTLTNWWVKLAVFAWVLSIFVDIHPSAAWIGAITGDLTSVLPIHGVAGAGTYEAGVVAGTSLFAIPVEKVLPAAINLHLFILASTLIGGAVSLLIPSRGASLFERHAQD